MYMLKRIEWWSGAVMLPPERLEKDQKLFESRLFITDKIQCVCYELFYRLTIESKVIDSNVDQQVHMRLQKVACKYSIIFGT